MKENSSRRTHFSRVSQYVAIGLLSAGCMASATTASADDEVEAASFPQVEQKFKGLKKRVRQLEAQVAVLQTQQLPVEVNVDCAPGNSVVDALTTHADGLGLLTINLVGTCNESITIARSNVIIQGQGAASIIQTPTGVNAGVSVVDNVSNVELRNLSVIGGPLAGVLVIKGAHATLRSVTVEQAVSGVMALDNGVLDVTGSTIRNNTQGVYSARGGVVSVSASTIESNTIGVLAFKQGMVLLTSATPELTTGTGTTVRNNNLGGLARSGGYIEVADATIESNRATGLLADSGGTLHFFSTINGTGNRIVNNTFTGVAASRNANLVFSDLTNVITGNQRGIVCTNNPSYLVPLGFTVTGNLAGDIVSCIP